MKRPLDYYDRLIESTLAARNLSLQPLSSDVLPTVDSDGRDIRIGRLQCLLSVDPASMGYFFAAQLAALVAVEDFNARSSPFTKNMSSDCNFYLSLAYQVPGLGQLEIVADYQSSVLEYTGLRPMTVVGGLTSSQSLLLALMGAVSTRSTVRNQMAAGSKNAECVPNISPSATSSALGDTNEYPYFARTVPGNGGDAAALIEYLTSIQVQHFAVLFNDDEYGGGFYNAIAGEAHTKNVTAYGFSYSLALGGSLTSTLANLKRSGLRYVFAIVTTDLYPLIGRAVYRANLLSDYVWFFSDALESMSDTVGHPLDLELAVALNHSAVVTLMEPHANTAIHKQQLLDYYANQSFVDYWASLYNDSTFNTSLLSSTLPEPSIFSMLTYDAVMAVGLASCGSPGLFTGPTLHHTILSTSFDGASGPVRFQATGSRDPSSLRYQLVNLVTSNVSGVYHVTGVPGVMVERTANGTSITGHLTFANDTTIPPPALGPYHLDMMLFPMGIRIFVWLLAGIGICFSLYCMGWTLLNRRHPKVKASQPPFLLLVCVGPLFLSIATVLINLQEPTPKQVLDAACISSTWLASIGFTTTFSALFAKTWRINRVHSNARKFRRVTIRVKDVLWPLAVLLFFNIGLLTAWLIVAPSGWERSVIEVDPYGRTVVSVGRCYEIRSESTAAQVFFGLLLGVNLVAMLLASYQSFRARNLPSEYHETYYIAVTNFVLLETYFIGVPILFLVHGDSTTSLVIRCLFNFVFGMAVLGPLFIPKFSKQTRPAQSRVLASVASQNAVAAVPSILSIWTSALLSWRSGLSSQNRPTSVVANRPSPVVSDVIGNSVLASGGSYPIGE